MSIIVAHLRKPRSSTLLGSRRDHSRIVGNGGRSLLAAERGGALDWGAADAGRAGYRDLVGPILIGVTAIAGAVVAVGVAWGWAVGAGTAAALLAATALWISLQDRVALTRSHAVPLAEGREARFEHMAAAVARDLGLDAPKLFVIEARPANGFSCGPRSAPCLAVSTGLLESYSRTELEAAVTQLLLRAKNRSWSSRGAAAFGAYHRSPAEVRLDDIRTAAFTRYPPALISAIDRADGARGRYAGLWFVDASPGSKETRIKALQDL
jgi:hypothetical protein